MATKKHYCFDCGGELVFDTNLTIKSKGVSGWWCMKCIKVELVYRKKVKNAVNSARRLLLHGKLGMND